MTSRLTPCAWHGRFETLARSDELSLAREVAGLVHEWVGRFLEGDLRAAQSIARDLEGWDLYVSRDLQKIRRYLREDTWVAVTVATDS